MTTKGMHAVGQAEVVILLQCLPDEKTIPKDIFTHFVQLYQEALSGKNITNSSTRRQTVKLVQRHHGPPRLLVVVSSPVSVRCCQVKNELTLK